MTPIPAAIRTRITRQRRVRQPIATIKIAEPSGSRRSEGATRRARRGRGPNLLKLGSGRGGIGDGVGTGGAVVGADGRHPC